MIKLTKERLQTHRIETHRMALGKRLRTPQEAIQFVNERGYIFFWPTKGTVMPSLWCAVAGDRPVPDNHDDPGNISWAWKDQLLDKKVWYYARVLKKRNTIISMEMIPFFYALSPNFGDPDVEIYDLYHQGLIPVEVKTIYEVLLEKGPLDTLALRREARLTSQNSNSPFTRALDILQRDLKVLPVAIAEVGTWRYAFVFDLTHRYYPDLLEKSRFLSDNNARTQILTKYFTSVGAASEKDIHSLFGWSMDHIQRTIQKMSEEGQIVSGVELEDGKIPVNCLAELLEKN